MVNGRMWFTVGLLLSIKTLSVHAELTLTNNGLGVNDNGIGQTWAQDANLLGTFEANAITQYGNDNNLITAIINANGGVARDTANDYDTDTYSLSAADFASGGMVNWWGAQAFIGYLNSIVYAGSNQWSLPTTIDSDTSVGYSQTTSHLGELFYNELGGLAGAAIPAGPFINVQSFGYWSGAEYSYNPDNAWALSTIDGNQFYYDKNNMFFAWAVSPYNLSAAPIPGSVWMFGSGILAIIFSKKRRIKVSTHS